MKRPTVSIAQGLASDVIEAKLGDIFFINSNIKAYNNSELSGLMPLVSMIISIRQPDKRVWLFAACVDSSLYTISKINNNKISLLGRKEVTFNINDIKDILLTKKFPTKVLGINVYGSLISTGEKFMSQMDMVKVNARMPDISKWPVKSINVWARCQQGLSGQELQRIVEKCGEDAPDKFIELIILSSVVKGQHLEKEQESTELISIEIASIVQKLQNMRIWYSHSTRFIKVHFDEIVDGSIRFKKRINPEDLTYYSVLVINDSPSYILVKPDEHGDTGVNFTFVNGRELYSKMLIFNIDNFRWALKQIENQLRSGAGSLHIPTVKATSYDLSTTTVFYDLGTTQELRVAESIEPTVESEVGETSLNYVHPLIVNTLQNATFPANSIQQNAVVSVDADGDLVSIDTTEMGRAPIEAEEPEVRPDQAELGNYLQYNPIDPPEVATEEEEE